MQRFINLKISRTIIRDETTNNLNSEVNMKKYEYVQKTQLFYVEPANIDGKICICMLLNEDVTDEQIVKLTALRMFFKHTHIVFVTDSHVQTPVASTINYASILRIDGEVMKRNAYLAFFKENIAIFTHMMVIDLCSLELTSRSFNFFNSNDWDVAFANQSYKYYDIDNLISEETRSFHEETDLSKKKIIKRTLQYHIPRDTPPIEVLSAYGGLAIYKSGVIQSDFFYKNDEHKSFNLAINHITQKMFIYPDFVIETDKELAGFYV